MLKEMRVAKKVFWVYNRLMSTAEWVEALKISSMVFFHIFIFVLIIASIYMLVLMRAVQKKVNQTLDKVQEVGDKLQEVGDKFKEVGDNAKDAVLTVGEAGGNLVGLLGPLASFFFLRPKKRKKNSWLENLVDSFM
jgi:uncharacterized protein YoxC